MKKSLRKTDNVSEAGRREAGGRFKTTGSRDNKVLLLLEDQRSQLAINAINVCREVGNAMMSFPPHCSHEPHVLGKVLG